MKINAWLFLFSLFFALTLSLLSKTAIANHLQQKAKLWTAITWQGPLSQGKKIQYYLKPELRFISRSESFQHAILDIALGYQYTPSLTLWLGNSDIDTRDPGKENTYQFRLWQQVSFNPIDNYLSSRTRLEQRKENEFAQWALRLRQQITLTLPIPHCTSYDFVLFDELFFNLNHPSWVNNNLINQNRAFIGLSIPITKMISLETGYLNQYEIRNPNRIAHILDINLKIKTA